MAMSPKKHTIGLTFYRVCQPALPAVSWIPRETQRGKWRRARERQSVLDVGLDSALAFHSLVKRSC